MTKEQDAINAIVAALENVIWSFEDAQFGVHLTDDMQNALVKARTALALAVHIRPSWTVANVAGLRGKSVSTIAYWCRNGWLDAERVGTGPWRIYGTRQELLDFDPPKPGPKAFFLVK